MDIISGKGSEAETNVVAMNAAVAIRLVNKISLEDAFELAKEKLINLEALQRLKKLQALCQ